MSNEYRLKQLNDPINYQVSLRGDQEEISETPLRYMLKERKIKERDSFGGYRFYIDNLKKRTNPTDEYQKKLEQEILQKKKIISDYEQNGGHLSQNQLKSLQKSGKFQKSHSAFNLFDINDIEENAKNIEYSKNLSVNENLIKVLDAQVDLLKRQSNDQFQKLTENEFKNSLYKTKRYRNLLNTDENGLIEPKVHSQFLAVNRGRVQTLKHVLTQDKPEYIPLEELEKIKQEHEIDLKDKEDDYYGRKKISKEELRKMRERAQKLLRDKQLFNMIQRPGYTNDNPLDPEDYEFINKYSNYLINKQNNYDKIGYEEEWNTTKVKSQNANGVVDRKDGLPGYLDQDDYRLYYYDINEGQGELNFERPLKIHKHIGKENTLKRTFRNEPGYEETKGKFYRTASAPDFNNITNKSNLNNNYDVNESNNRDFVNNGDMMNASKSFNLGGSKNDQFMKLIFGMLSKNEEGDVAKNKIISEMKLDENAINELGFKDKNEFEDKLNNFPSKNPDYMTEEEFYSFLLHKNKMPRNYSTININENQLYKTNIPKKSQTIPVSPRTLQKNNSSEILPGMSTSYFDFLKNPSTTARLKHINKTLKGKRSKSTFDDSRHKNINKSFDFTKNNLKNIRKNKLNKSYDNEKNNYIDNNNNLYNTINGHFNVHHYNKKSDLNFTIPKPFEFLKEDYHGKKLIKMKEILEERKKKEDGIFKHIFHANPLNKRMFDTKGDLRNVIEREKSARQQRVNQKKIEILSSMKPFSFYDADFKSFVERKNQECLPPEFVPFKANPIKYKSQVNMYDGNIKNDREARQERIHQRALSTFNAASLPPRMEMHEKQKKLQEKEKSLIEKQKEELDRNKRIFKAQKAPNFNLLHEKFINALEKKKRAVQPTVPKPFTFHEPKKKAELCQFLDFENNPKAKNPKKAKNIEIIRKKMQKKPKIEPPSTKSLKLLMETRRRELEDKKIREENIRREDELRKERQKRLNDRVRSSSVIQGNKKELKEKKMINQKQFKERLKEDASKYKDKLNIINQKVENRPLMMEIQGKKKLVEGMEQDKNI